MNKTVLQVVFSKLVICLLSQLLSLLDYKTLLVVLMIYLIFGAEEFYLLQSPWDDHEFGIAVLDCFARYIAGSLDLIVGENGSFTRFWIF